MLPDAIHHARAVIAGVREPVTEGEMPGGATSNTIQTLANQAQPGLQPDPSFPGIGLCYNQICVSIDSRQV